MPFLIDAHHLSAQQTGNETWIRNICRELTRLTKPGDLVFATTDAGVSHLKALTRESPLRLSPSSVRRLAVDLPRLTQRVHADAMLLQYTMPLRSAAPCVVMVHDTSFEDASAPNWMSQRTAMRIRWSVRNSVRRAARLLAPSEFTRACLVRLYGVPPEQISLAPNAVDPDLARHLDSSPAQLSRHEGFRVLAVGNVLPRKNLRVLARAVAQLRTEGYDATMRIVGSVPETSAPLEREIRALLDGAVSFTGYVDDARLATEYLCADVLGFPSVYEGFGIPALEAMYAGTPVVVSDATSLPEIVGDAGAVVPAEDASSWAAALRRMHDDRAWVDNLRARGKKRASNFSWRASAEAVLNALEGAAGTRRSS